MIPNRFFSFFIFIGIAITACTPLPIKEVDILIENGRIYNGISSSPTEGLLAINSDTISYIGSGSEYQFLAKKTIDAQGLIVAPGFIDPHTHADRDLKKPELSHNLPFLMQGITTVVVGSDGNSFFPSSEYRELYEKHGIGTNAVLMVGHGTLRKLVVGRSNRAATEAEITNMQQLVQKEMDAGAFGMTTGLFYAPGSYSDTEEIIALAKVVAQNDGIYDTHLRDEGSYTIGLQNAVKEAIEIGRQAQLPIHLSHIKCLGVDVWDQSQAVIDMVEAARKEGINVTANQYPYDASATGLQSAVVPRWAESGGMDSLYIRYKNPALQQRILTETTANIRRRGGPEKLLVVMAADSIYVGKNLLEIAQLLDTSPEKAVFEIIHTGTVRVASFNMKTEDIHNFMRQDWLVTGSDGNTGHPRKYGSFPRKYRKYILEEKVISEAQFINNSTSKTASIFKIPRRGQLKTGYFADVILFKPDTFQDKADYVDAFQYAEGLEHCILNGHLVVENGVFQDSLKGRVLIKE